MTGDQVRHEHTPSHNRDVMGAYPPWSFHHHQWKRSIHEISWSNRRSTTCRNCSLKNFPRCLWSHVQRIGDGIETQSYSFDKKIETISNAFTLNGSMLADCLVEVIGRTSRYYTKKPDQSHKLPKVVLRADWQRGQRGTRTLDRPE